MSSTPPDFHVVSIFYADDNIKSKEMLISFRAAYEFMVEFNNSDERGVDFLHAGLPTPLCTVLYAQSAEEKKDEANKI